MDRSQGTYKSMVHVVIGQGQEDVEGHDKMSAAYYGHDQLPASRNQYAPANSQYAPSQHALGQSQYAPAPGHYGPPPGQYGPIQGTPSANPPMSGPYIPSQDQPVPQSGSYVPSHNQYMQQSNNPNSYSSQYTPEQSLTAGPQGRNVPRSAPHTEAAKRSAPSRRQRVSSHDNHMPSSGYQHQPGDYSRHPTSPGPPQYSPAYHEPHKQTNVLPYSADIGRYIGGSEASGQGFATLDRAVPAAPVTGINSAPHERGQLTTTQHPRGQPTTTHHPRGQPTTTQHPRGQPTATQHPRGQPATTPQDHGQPTSTYQDRIQPSSNPSRLENILIPKPRPYARPGFDDEKSGRDAAAERKSAGGFIQDAGPSMADRERYLPYNPPDMTLNQSQVPDSRYTETKPIIASQHGSSNERNSSSDRARYGYHPQNPEYSPYQDQNAPRGYLQNAQNAYSHGMAPNQTAAGYSGQRLGDTRSANQTQDSTVDYNRPRNSPSASAGHEPQFPPTAKPNVIPPARAAYGTQIPHDYRAAYDLQSTTAARPSHHRQTSDDRTEARSRYNPSIGHDSPMPPKLQDSQAVYDNSRPGPDSVVKSNQSSLGYGQQRVDSKPHHTHESSDNYVRINERSSNRDHNTGVKRFYDRPGSDAVDATHNRGPSQTPYTEPKLATDYPYKGYHDNQVNSSYLPGPDKANTLRQTSTDLPYSQLAAVSSDSGTFSGRGSASGPDQSSRPGDSSRYSQPPSGHAYPPSANDGHSYYREVPTSDHKEVFNVKPSYDETRQNAGQVEVAVKKDNLSGVTSHPHRSMTTNVKREMFTKPITDNQQSIHSPTYKVHESGTAGSHQYVPSRGVENNGGRLHSGDNSSGDLKHYPYKEKVEKGDFHDGYAHRHEVDKRDAADDRNMRQLSQDSRGSHTTKYSKQEQPGRLEDQSTQNTVPASCPATRTQNSVSQPKTPPPQMPSLTHLAKPPAFSSKQMQASRNQGVSTKSQPMKAGMSKDYEELVKQTEGMESSLRKAKSIGDVSQRYSAAQAMRKVDGKGFKTKSKRKLTGIARAKENVKDLKSKFEGGPVDVRQYLSSQSEGLLEGTTSPVGQEDSSMSPQATDQVVPSLGPAWPGQRKARQRNQHTDDNNSPRNDDGDTRESTPEHLPKPKDTHYQPRTDLNLPYSGNHWKMEGNSSQVGQSESYRHSGTTPAGQQNAMTTIPVGQSESYRHSGTTPAGQQNAMTTIPVGQSESYRHSGTTPAGNESTMRNSQLGQSESYRHFDTTPAGQQNAMTTSPVQSGSYRPSGVAPVGQQNAMQTSKELNQTASAYPWRNTTADVVGSRQASSIPSRRPVTNDNLSKTLSDSHAAKSSHPVFKDNRSESVLNNEPTKRPATASKINDLASKFGSAQTRPDLSSRAKGCNEKPQEDSQLLSKSATFPSEKDTKVSQNTTDVHRHPIEGPKATCDETNASKLRRTFDDPMTKDDEKAPGKGYGANALSSSKTEQPSWKRSNPSALRTDSQSSIRDQSKPAKEPMETRPTKPTRDSESTLTCTEPETTIIGSHKPTNDKPFHKSMESILDDEPNYYGYRSSKLKKSASLDDESASTRQVPRKSSTTSIGKKIAQRLGALYDDDDSSGFFLSKTGLDEECVSGITSQGNYSDLNSGVNTKSGSRIPELTVEVDESRNATRERLDLLDLSNRGQDMKCSANSDGLLSLTEPTKALVIQGNSEQVPASISSGSAPSRNGSTPSHIGSPAHFTCSLSDVCVTEGDVIQLRVIVSGTSPFSVCWLHNKKEIRENAHYQITSHGSLHKLRVAAAVAEDAGLYECEVSNEWGEDDSMCMLTVTPANHSAEESLGSSKHLIPHSSAVSGLLEDQEEEPPFIEDLSPQHLSVAAQQDIELTATFQGKPNPLVTWSRDRSEIQSGGHVTIVMTEGRSVLTVRNCTATDTGCYTVRLSNELGKDQMSASVTVQDVPEPPVGQPCVTNISSHSLVLSWSGPSYDGGSPVTVYKVEQCQVQSHKGWTTLTDSCRDTSYQVMEIVPDVEYKFRVSVANKLGFSEAGQESETAIAVTDRHIISENEYTDSDYGARSPLLLSGPLSPLALMAARDELAFTPREVSITPGRKYTDFYTVGMEIGKGRFGSVFKCTEKFSCRELAAKFIKIKPSQRAELHGEMVIMNQLHHPKLLLLWDAFESPREMVLILEHVAGGELFERIIDEDYILTEVECIHFMRQICDGVKFMHDKNILHLDLKPENILCVTRNSNEIKIIDFGLARNFDPNSPTKVMFGTPEFVAPEVINYDQIGYTTDMWSVGVICYILLSGLSPFLGDNEAETLANVTTAQWDFDEDVASEISADSKDFVTSLLRKVPRKRMTADKSLGHRWLSQDVKFMRAKRLSTDKHKRFIARSKWQKTGTAIRALGRMSILQKSLSKSSLSSGRSRTSSVNSDSVMSTSSDQLSSLPPTPCEDHSAKDLNQNVPPSPIPVCEPKFLQAMNDLVVDEGDTATFRVKVKGHPAPTLTWYKQGDEISHGRHYRVESEGEGAYRFTVLACETSDDAEYECRAVNSEGRIRCHADLFVEPSTK